jgi:SAM-dependent methyltransferase
MNNIERWKPSKFVPVDAHWAASRDVSEVGLGSRFIADILARVYNDAIQAHATGRLLDLGCGKVPLYGMYRSRVSEAICVDWANSLHANEHIDQFVDLNAALPFADESFDTILTTDVLEHIREPDLFWQEMSRVLKSNGKIILSVPFLYWLHEEPHDYCRYTSYKLRDFCERQGLEVLRLESYGGGLEVVLDIVSKHLTRHSRISAIHLWIANRLTRFAPLRSLSEDMKEVFPLGYCLIAQKAAASSPREQTLTQA